MAASYYSSPAWQERNWVFYGGPITGGSYEDEGENFTKWASGDGGQYLENYNHYENDRGAYGQWENQLDLGKANYQTWNNTQRVNQLVNDAAAGGGDDEPAPPPLPRAPLNVPDYTPLPGGVVSGGPAGGSGHPSQWGASPITPSAGGVPFGGITDLVNRQQSGAYTPFQGVPSPAIPAAPPAPGPTQGMMEQALAAVGPQKLGPTGADETWKDQLVPRMDQESLENMASGPHPLPTGYAQGGQVGMPANALYGQHGNPSFGNSVSDQAQLGGGQGFGDTVSQQAQAISSQADALSGMGRGPDSNLVHMSNQEVGALQQMSPTGQLPINPQTGLPEAGILQSILPIAGGIVGGMFGGPLGAAAGSGLGTVIGGGSLEQGLMSGIMSFGVGSIMGSFAEVGAAGADGLVSAGDGIASASSQLNSSAANAALDAAVQPAAASTLPAGALASSGGRGAGFEMLAPQDMLTQPLSSLGRGAGFEMTAPAGAWAQNAALPSAADTGSGIGNFISNNSKPSNFGDAMSGVSQTWKDGTFMDQLLKDPIKGVGAAAFGGLGLASSYAEEDRRGNNDDEAYDYRRRYMDRDYIPTPEGYRPGTDAEHKYFSKPNFHYAEGGQVPIPPIAPGGPAGPTPPQMSVPAGGIAGPAPQPQQPQQPEAQQLIQITKAAIMDQVPPEAKQQIFAAFIQAFGADALEDLMLQVAEGDNGQTKGPGDGQSDSIPAQIDGEQPAALSTDEFVIPADVVSHLGNGSSDAGSDRLYDMLDRVRGERTGSTSEPATVNPEQLMPA